HPPVHGATIPEGGFDLTLVVKNLPENAEPQAIIYHHYKSFPPKITDTTKAGVVMKARIITSSSVIQISPKANHLSDRLIYKTRDSNRFIKFNNWTKD